MIYRVWEQAKLSKFISLCILHRNERMKTLISRVKSAREKIKNFSIEMYTGNKGNCVIEITFCFIPITKSSVEIQIMANNARDLVTLNCIYSWKYVCHLSKIRDWTRAIRPSDEARRRQAVKNYFFFTQRYLENQKSN